MVRLTDTYFLYSGFFKFSTVNIITHTNYFYHKKIRNPHYSLTLEENMEC